MADSNRYAGVLCTPEDEFTANGGRFGDTSTQSREALRELLPYVTLGWAPESIDGSGLLCGPRALARSLMNALRYHEPRATIPQACSVAGLVGILNSSNEYRDWRKDTQEKEAVRKPETALQEGFSTTNNNFYDYDLQYLVGYFNYKNFLPMKFRLGLITQSMAHVSRNTKVRIQHNNYEIKPSVEEELDPPHPVVWLHYTIHPKINGVEQGHYQSIGPQPNSGGVQLFRDWGLEREAKRIINTGLFYISREFDENAHRSYYNGAEMLALRKYNFLYQHPAHAENINPAGRSRPNDEYVWAVRPRSRFHDLPQIIDHNKRLISEGPDVEGYVYIGKAVDRAGFLADGARYDSEDNQLLPIRKLVQYPETTGNGVQRMVHINGTYLPAKAQNPTSSSPLPGSSSAPSHKSTPITSPPEPVPRPKPAKPSKPAEVSKRSESDGRPKSPRRAQSTKPHQAPPKKRGPSDDNGTGAATKGSPLKKPKPNGDDSYPVARPQNFVGIQPSIYRAYSERPIRTFRAKEDSDVRSTGTFYDDLAFKANDILVAIQPIPDKPFYPFWARTQDLREGTVAPGVLEEFTEELYGERYLPWGLQNDNVLRPVPMTFNTYLQLGERHCRSLGKECDVDPDAQWPNDFIKQILEHRLRRGIPMAFWKALEPAVFGGGSPSSHAERYVRMKNWNSRQFLPDIADGRAFVWHMDPRAKFHYLPTHKEVMYAHDKNWGLQLSRTGRRRDLNSEDTTLIKEIDKVCPSSFYPRPVVHKPLTLLQKTAKKGRQFLFGEPMSGDKTRFSFNTTMNHDLYNYKKNNGFDNTDPTPRPVIAVQPQHSRKVPGYGKCLQFAVGDIIWMEAPVGPKPWQGWKASSHNDPRMNPWSGFVYPNKVRDLNEEERRKHDLDKAINNHNEKWAQKRLAEEEARVARKNAAVYGHVNPIPMPTQENTATEGTSTESAPGSKTAPLKPGATVGGAPLRPASGEWFGAGKKQKPSNAKPCFNAFVDWQRPKLEKDALAQKATPADPEKDADLKFHIFDNWTTEFQKDIEMGLAESLEATGLFDFATKSELRPESRPPGWLAEAIRKWESSPAAEKTPFRMPTPPTPSPAPRNPVVLPTTNYVKPLYQRSPVAGKRIRDPVKQCHRLQSIHWQGDPTPKPAPKMGPLRDEKMEPQKKIERQREELRREQERLDREKEDFQRRVDEFNRREAEANKSKKPAEKKSEETLRREQGTFAPKTDTGEKKTSKKRKNQASVENEDGTTEQHTEGGSPPKTPRKN